MTSTWHITFALQLTSTFNSAILISPHTSPAAHASPASCDRIRSPLTALPYVRPRLADNLSYIPSRFRSNRTSNRRAPIDSKQQDRGVPSHAGFPSAANCSSCSELRLPGLTMRPSVRTYRRRPLTVALIFANQGLSTRSQGDR